MPNSESVNQNWFKKTSLRTTFFCSRVIKPNSRSLFRGPFVIPFLGLGGLKELKNIKYQFYVSLNSMMATSTTGTIGGG